MKKYHAVCYPGDSSEYAWDVQLVQNWHEGQYLPAIAVGCSEANAKRIADCLNACEGVRAENVNVNQLILNYAELKVKYNNLRCDGLDHLRDVLNTQNGRGEYSAGGCDYNTEAGRAWREASTWLALQG